MLHSVKIQPWILVSFVCATFVICYYNIAIELRLQQFEHSLNISCVENSTTLPNTSIFNLRDNYFQSAQKLSNGKFIVDTAKCKIPDIKIWPPDVVKLTKKMGPAKCNTKLKNVTYVSNQEVIIDEKVLHDLGYSLKNVSCCYRIVERVQQNMIKFDINADRKFKYSKTCYPMKKVTQPLSGYITVNCTALNEKGKKFSYQNLHAVAIFPKDNKQIQEKISYWKQNQNSQRETNCLVNSTTCNQSRPPNVFLIGIDSTSRQHFHRFMNKSVAFLNKIDAVEMNGYTKVGDNTLPNYLGFISGYTPTELSKLCFPKGKSVFDKCPLLWGKYSSSKYLTAHLEDSPKLNAFNYNRVGFINQPTDMYIRPWMLAAYKNRYFANCLGYQRPEEIILNYMVDLATLAESKNLPYFITSWMTDLTHENINKLQQMDTILTNVLQKLEERWLLENTVLIVISDHGYRWGPIRSTTSGWFENKLPVLYIKLPTKLAEQYPSWQDSLRFNGNQLATPFDVYKMLADIVTLSSAKNKTAISNRGVSLFEKVPSRSCKEAGVPPEYCACSPADATSNKLNYTTVELAANAAVDNINKRIPKSCAILDLSKITAVAATWELRNESLLTTEYIINFNTSPGDFSFEGLVQVKDTAVNATFNVLHIQRTSKKSRATNCLKRSEVSSFELLCYCKNDESNKKGG